MPLAKKVALKELVAEFAQRNKNDESIPVYSVTNSAGFCADYFSKDVFSQNLKTYKIVPRGCFAYNPSRINVGSVDCQEVEERVIVSPLYVVFSVSERLDRHFLRYFLKSPMGLTQIKAFSVGSVRDCLKFSALKKIEIPLPPLAEQERIAAELDAVVATLKKRQTQLAELEALVESRFVELFGDLKQNTKALPLSFLSELGVWTSGGTPSRSCPGYFQGDVDWFTAGELNDLFLTSSTEKITCEAIEKSSAKIFAKNSLLVGMYDTAAFKMGILTKDASSNQACACITPNSTINVVWLYYALQAKKAVFLMERRGVRQKNLSLQVIKNFQLPVPPLELQERFAAEVERVEAIKAKVRDGIAETQTLFDALTQKYFG